MSGISSGVNYNGQSVNLDAARTFLAFADKADSVGGRSVLRMSGTDRTVVVGKDFVGNIGRRQATKDLNDETRTNFLKAVKDMYGGSLENVPDEVKKALELHNFTGKDGGGTGLPLTARRIRAVKAAIEDSLGQDNVEALRNAAKATDAEEAIASKKSNVKDMHASLHSESLIWVTRNLHANAVGLSNSIVKLMQATVEARGPSLSEEERRSLLKDVVKDELKEVRKFNSSSAASHKDERTITCVLNLLALRQALVRGEKNDWVSRLNVEQADLNKATGYDGEHCPSLTKTSYLTAAKKQMELLGKLDLTRDDDVLNFLENLQTKMEEAAASSL